MLTVRAQRRWEWGDNQEVLIAERPQGVFTRQLFLGDTLDAEHVQANYDHGVLRLSIPVSEQAKPRKVEVAQGANGSHAIPANASSSS